MGTTTFTLLLDYLYNKFTVTFILSIIGISIKEVVYNVNAGQRISISKVLASTIFSTIIMCAVRECIDLSFGVYVLLCVVASMWSPKLISLAMNTKVIGAIIKKCVKVTLSETIADTIEDVIDEETKAAEEKAGSKTKDENTGEGI